jgi:lipopolysaccharide export LptBFGC system permease protein LptF
MIQKLLIRVLFSAKYVSDHTQMALKLNIVVMIIVFLFYGCLELDCEAKYSRIYEKSVGNSQETTEKPGQLQKKGKKRNPISSFSTFTQN